MVTQRKYIGNADDGIKHIIPLLSQIMSAPFATAYPPLIDASINAVEAVLVNVWPRVAYHRGEILQGLVICWCRIEAEGMNSKDLQRIQTNIQRIVNLITEILKKDLEVADEYQILINSDGRLRDLFIV